MNKQKPDSEEQRLALIELHKQDLEKKAEEIEIIWEEHSQLVGEDIDSLQYFAGRNVMTVQDFRKATEKLLKSSRNEWIDVKKQNPEFGKTVLLYLKSGWITCGYLKQQGEDPLLFSWQLFGPMQNVTELLNDTLTHWMKLPQSPKL